VFVCGGPGGRVETGPGRLVDAADEGAGALGAGGVVYVCPPWSIRQWGGAAREERVASRGVHPAERVDYLDRERMLLISD
jgi:hypothetical protein